MGRNVIIVFNPVKSRIGHAQLLSFVNEGRAPKAEQDRRHSFRRHFFIDAFREIVIDAAIAVMIFKENRVPAVIRRRCLAGR